MSRFPLLGLPGFFLLLLGLTLVSVRSGGSEDESRSPVAERPVSLVERTVPVEVFEEGKTPTTLQVRILPID